MPMLSRRFGSVRPHFITADECIRPRLSRAALALRAARAAPYVTISDPPKPGEPSRILLAHPKDPSNQPNAAQGSSYNPAPSPAPTPAPAASSPPVADASTAGASDMVDDGAIPPPPPPHASVPAKFVHPPIDPQTGLPHTPASPLVHINPPFNTHKFFSVLERSFPTPIARNLMRVTRALLIDRVGRVKRDALTTQDLESQAYLFKAALSELRSETSVLTRNETAAMRAATTALRREVDTLETRMREDIATLKHEIQMDLDSRKNEARSDLKRIDMQIEEVLSRALITIGELKTQVEESRWEKLKAAVGALAVLSLVIIISLELYVVKPSKKKETPPPPPPPPPPPVILPGGDQPFLAS
ncbi:hypothetical protein L226DRAFT_613284 [Lentinus tigrinus ALCF2SS1-7]|uniref:DUF1640-domain-containing protein n=1 Tax=Lentinus tigrinus ALCF2SS1-6 TaxID=1328759 RepID=A0A5C2SF70_9APHY|nr:hypothetical protein L227DRAFT_573810 [Lentinus tigrinus ALCF2SS1-6]RPD74435.1 hypothetical protein L226DRAFT_613284 [Lentinus tigrinus ALCF2SS1-7]